MRGWPPLTCPTASSRAAPKSSCSRRSGRLGVELLPRTLQLPDGSCVEIDGGADGPPPILAEVYAHRGRLKGSQSDKLLADALELVATRRLALPCGHCLPLLVLGCTRWWPFQRESGMLPIMRAHAIDPSPIPSAPFDDLDLDRPADEEEWDRRVMALATARIAAERVRLERLGIIDANGDLVSRDLPPDMLPDSDTTLETG